MRYTISIVVLDNLECTRKCLELIEAHTDSEYELIISDNGSKDGTAEFLSEYSRSHSSCRIITYPYNTGFGYPHNQALLLARGEYFVVLNNDIFIHESGWLEKMRNCFRLTPKLGLVGFVGGCSALDDTGTGMKDPCRVEYVEASCLMIPCDMGREYGLFSEAYELVYWEDVDLSLRYRQMGLDIQLVNCKHQHINCATSANIDRLLLSRVMDRNKHTFLKRWSGYLQKRSLTGRVLARAVTDDVDSLLAVTTVLDRLKQESPLIRLDLVTNCPALFQGHSSFYAIYSPQELSDDLSAYDRVIDFDFSLAPSGMPKVLSLAEQAAVSVKRLVPVLPKTPNQAGVTAIDSKIAVINGLKGNEDTERLIEIVAKAGYEAVVLDPVDYGNPPSKTNKTIEFDLSRILEIISSASLFIGGSSVFLKLAQALSVPSIAILQPGEDPIMAGIDPIQTKWIFHCVDTITDVEDIIKSLHQTEDSEIRWLQAKLLDGVLLSSHLSKVYRDAQIQAAHEREMYRLNIDKISGEYENTISCYQKMVHDMTNSLSWKMTLPFRSFLNLFIK